MRAKEFITEYNRDVTKRQYAQGIIKAFATSTNAFDKKLYNDFLKKYSSDPEKLKDMTDQVFLEMVISEFEQSDPTKNKLYTPWIAREYVKGNIKAIEDLSRITSALSLYDKYKNKKIFIDLFNKPEYKDIYKIDADKLENMSIDLAKVDTTKKQDKVEQKGDAEEFYNDNDLRIIVPKDTQAACYYGQGTKWCTAATQGVNLFSRYNQEGRLYIIIPKKPMYQGEKYQFSFVMNQFMDEQDNTRWKLSKEDFRKRFPQLGKVFDKEIKEHGTGWFLKDPDSIEKEDKLKILESINANRLSNGTYFILLNNIKDTGDYEPLAFVDYTKVRRLADILGYADKDEKTPFVFRKRSNWKDIENELTQLFQFEPNWSNLDFFIMNPDLDGGIVCDLRFEYSDLEIKDKPGLHWAASIGPVANETKTTFNAIKSSLPNFGKFPEIDDNDRKNRIKNTIIQKFAHEKEAEIYQRYLEDDLDFDEEI